MVLDNRPSRPLPKSAHVMQGRLMLAQQMKKKGKTSEARAVLEDLVESYTVALGAGASATLTAKLSLGNLLRGEREEGKAQKLFEEVIAGGGQEDKLKAMMSLAALLRDKAGPVDPVAQKACKGEFCTLGANCANCAREELLEKAKKLLADVVLEREAELGADHSDTWRAKVNLAVMQAQMGYSNEAQDLYRQVLKGRKSEATELAKGDDKAAAVAAAAISVLRPMMNLAILLDEQGGADNIAEARQLYEEVVKSSTERLGPEHTDTLGAKLNLAVLVDEELGDAKLGRQLYTEVLRGYGPMYGEGAEETLKVKLQLAVLEDEVGSAGSLARARALYEEVGEGYRKIYGASSLETLRVRMKLGMLVHGLDKQVEARALYEEVAKGRAKVLGKEHPETLRAKLCVAVVRNEQKDSVTSREMYGEVVEGFQKSLGTNHPDTLGAKMNLAVLWKQVATRLPPPQTTEAKKARVAEAAEAKKLFDECIRGYRKSLGDEHASTLRARFNFGNLMHSIGQHAKAKVQFEAVVKGRVAVLGHGHSDTLGAKLNLAAIHHELGGDEGHEAAHALYVEVHEHSKPHHAWHEHVVSNVAAATAATAAFKAAASGSGDQAAASGCACTGPEPEPEA